MTGIAVHVPGQQQSQEGQESPMEGRCIAMHKSKSLVQRSYALVNFPKQTEKLVGMFENQDVARASPQLSSIP
jgi:hypothetical protein